MADLEQAKQEVDQAYTEERDAERALQEAIRVAIMAKTKSLRATLALAEADGTVTKKLRDDIHAQIIFLVGNAKDAGKFGRAPLDSSKRARLLGF